MSGWYGRTEADVEDDSEGLASELVSEGPSPPYDPSRPPAGPPTPQNMFAVEVTLAAAAVLERFTSWSGPMLTRIRGQISRANGITIEMRSMAQHELNMRDVVHISDDPPEADAAHNETESIRTDMDRETRARMTPAEVERVNSVVPLEYVDDADSATLAAPVLANTFLHDHRAVASSSSRPPSALMYGPSSLIRMTVVYLQGTSLQGASIIHDRGTFSWVGPKSGPYFSSSEGEAILSTGLRQGMPIRGSLLQRTIRSEEPPSGAIRVLTWNAGGLHAQVFQEVETFIRDAQLDLMLIQETKWSADMQWSSRGYHYVHSAGVNKLDKVCGNWTLPVGTAHQADSSELMDLLAANSLCVLNSWTKPTNQRLATFTFGRLESQIDFVITKQAQANQVARKAGVMTEFPVACWRDSNSAAHHPVFAFITLPFRLWRPPEQHKQLRVDNEAVIRDLRSEHPSPAMQALKERARCHGCTTLAQLDAYMLQAAAELYPRTRPGRVEGDQPLQLANCAREMWGLFRKMKKHKFSAKGVFEAWKDWALFQRAHRLHKTRSQERSKLRRNELLDQAQTAAQSGDMHAIWATVKALAPKTKPRKLQLHKDGRMLTPQAELQWITEAFGERYGSSFAKTTPFPQREHPPFQVPLELVQAQLEKLQVRKAVPPGAVPSAIWRMCAEEVSGFITNRVNETWSGPQIQVEQSWVDADVALLPKGKKSASTPLDMRPIGLQHPVGKVFMKILIQNARTTITNLVKEWPQTAYVSGRSTSTAIKTVLAHCAKVRNQCKQARLNIHQQYMGLERAPCSGGLQICMDMSAAFDLVAWADVRTALELAGIDPSVQELLLQWLRQVRYRFHHRSNTAVIVPSWGLRQGCVASPVLWAVYTVLICRTLEAKFGSGWMAEHGSLYADDAHFRWEFRGFSQFECVMKEVRQVLATFRRFGMRVNQDKTKAILALTGALRSKLSKHYIRKAGEGRHLLLSPGDPRQWLPLEDQAEYLGIIVSYQNFEAQSVRHRVAKANSRRWVLAPVLHSRRLSPKYKLNIWRSCVQTSMTYGLHCMALSPALHQELHMNAMKHIRAITSDRAHVTGRTHEEILCAYKIPTVQEVVQMAHSREQRTMAGDWMYSTSWHDEIEASLQSEACGPDQDPEDEAVREDSGRMDMAFAGDDEMDTFFGTVSTKSSERASNSSDTPQGKRRREFARMGHRGEGGSSWSWQGDTGRDNGPLVPTLARLAIKLDEEIRVLKQNTGIVMWMKPGADSVLPHLYNTAVEFKKQQKDNPKFSLAHVPLRSVLALAMFRELGGRLDRLLKTPDLMKAAETRGWRDQSGWKYQVLNGALRHLEVDREKPTVSDAQMQLVIQQILECLKQPVIHQFHCTRRMTEAMDSQATFLMSVSMRSEAAAKLWHVSFIMDPVSITGTTTRFSDRCDGSVVTWGSAYQGGDSVAFQSKLKDVSKIYSSDYAFAAVRSDGSVVTWGNAGAGGDSASVQDMLRNVQKIQASSHAFAAVLADGSVVTWGNSRCGGDSSAVQGQLVQVQHIWASKQAFAALAGGLAAASSSSGSLVTWGSSAAGGDSEAVRAQLAQGVRQIAASELAFGAVLSDGSVVTWGDGDYGGDSSKESYGANSSAVQEQLKDVLDVQASEASLKDVRRLYSSGHAFAAVLGDGSVLDGRRGTSGSEDLDVSVVTWGNAAYGGDSGAVSAALFDFETGLRLVKLRAEAMQEATEQGPQAEGQVDAGGDARACGEGGSRPSPERALCRECVQSETDTCQVANELFPNGFSCAGTKSAIERLVELAWDPSFVQAPEKAGCLQAKLLKTSGAFHTQRGFDFRRLMEPARAKLLEALLAAEPKKPPKCDLYANLTGARLPAGTPVKEIITTLADQLTNCVLWESCMRAALKDGLSQPLDSDSGDAGFSFYELGPMKQLKSMMKRVDYDSSKDQTSQVPCSIDNQAWKVTSQGTVQGGAERNFHVVPVGDRRLHLPYDVRNLPRLRPSTALFLNEPVLVIPFPASASAAKAMSETVDPLRWSYKELIDSFPAYHEGADGESRPLRDFASRLPVTTSRPREDPQPREEARPSRPPPKPKEQATDRGQRAAAKPRRAAAARIPEVLPVRSQAPAAAPRGPVPPPFAAGPSLPEEDEEEIEAEAGEAEALSPEQYTEWLKYYRECIEYFEQCEQNCAKEAGVEPRPRIQNLDPARQPLPFPSEASFLRGMSFASLAGAAHAWTFKFGMDIDWKPYAWQNATTMELMGIGKDIADGMTAHCDNLTIESVQTDWLDCWTSDGQLGPKLADGTLDACMTYSHGRGSRDANADWSIAILDDNKPAGLMTLLTNGVPSVSGWDDLAGKTVIDVGGWAPTADGLGYVTNKCSNMPYSDSITLVVGPENDDAMNMLRNGTGDAVFIYADQAALYQCSAVGDATVSFNCSLWDGFGTEYAYVQTGQKGYAINGTTLAMTKPGSAVPGLINGCLASFMQTKEYYDVCVKNGMVGQCFPNSYFPIGSNTMSSYDYTYTSFDGGLGATPQPLLQALQSLQALQQQQQLQMLQLQQVQQLLTGSLLNGGLLNGGLGGGLCGGLLGLGPSLQSHAPAASNLSNEMLANLLMAWYYSGYYTGEYAARQGQQ
ncbi:Malonyl-CoA-acyl carrier protein transacylase, mitochondrial [Symbiodinium microadriaticum]|uniref:Malonyl-CoA-acyl carrier protein transacylase, mitochondrial n=1 Tax=Symbiodinium microadriaticum TaxID=2951 RepID=A0A1Q9F5D3_SYMMI|nr:Malonyl-CoA-acyl carrier protein transacylase, mitochondrial [Symbiodinium microadriaticum]